MTNSMEPVPSWEKVPLRDVLPELPLMLRLSFGATLQSLVDWSRPLIFNAFMSTNFRASDQPPEQVVFEMDSVSMAILTLNIMVFATAYGFNGGVDTYAPDAFGSGNMIELHLVLYRQLVLLAGMAVLLLLVLTQTESLLLLAQQPAEKCHRTVELLWVLMWSVPGDLVYDCLGRWAKAQQYHVMMSVVAGSGLLVNLAINWFFRDPNHPLRGPMIGIIAQNTVLPFLTFAAFRMKGHRFVTAPVATVLSSLGQQLRTSLAGMVWFCAELWAWEVQIFEAGLLHDGAAASYATLSSTYSICIMIPAGVGVALTSMLGKLIGEGKFGRARALLQLGCVVGTLLVVSYSIPLACLRGSIAVLLGGGVPAVETIIMKAFPLTLTLQFADGILLIVRSWLTVRGYQGFGAVSALLAYYVVALPLGYYLAFRQGQGVPGLYMGLGAGVFLIVGTGFLRVGLDVKQAQACLKM
eukprot:TRINITY_DN16915_c0_g1_i4.p1 TRINITY_DN16915_c0_g1~~TRINITY_DN16915_c0_g1_i4.p1  ORF type:complete len:467 (+),score=70.18 TRINITY_DN16915_c0_g1_i4:43-1443(+)